MEVIEHGNKYKIKKCRWCNCTFSYVNKDIICKNVRTGEIGYRSAYFIQCPECGDEEESL